MRREAHTGTIRQIAVLGNHLPRQCGIATFTTDLSGAIAAEFSQADCFVVAMNDAGKRYVYPPRVRFEVAESDIASYRVAADFLNGNNIDDVSVQHGYGIFGALNKHPCKTVFDRTPYGEDADGFRLA